MFPARVLETAREARALPPIIHRKMNSGKEPFKCGMESAPVFAPVFTALRRGELLRRGKECGVRPNLISVITKHRAPRPVK